MKDPLNKLLLNLQLFAEDDSEDDDLDLEDFSEDELEEEDSNKEDSEDEKSKDKSEKNNKKQTRDKNREEARKRREREQQEAIEKAKKEAYAKGLSDGKRGALKVNTYTNEPIEDDIDLENFEIMQKLESQGKDPLKDFVKEKARIEREKKADEAKQKEKSDLEKTENEKKLEKEKKDRLDFVKFLGSKEKAVEVFKDPDFKILLRGRIGKDSLIDIYKDLLEFRKRNASNVKGPDLPGSGKQGSDIKKSTKDMTYDEYEEYMKKKYRG